MILVNDNLLDEIEENNRIIEEADRTLEQINRLTKLMDEWVGEK